MGSFHDASDGGPIPQHMLDSMPPDLRAMMDKHMAGPTARGYPAAFLDEASPPVEGLDYGRIASAPMSWMTFRNAKSPCYVRIGGLTSERGQGMNGKWGWAVKTIGKIADLAPDARLKVLYREDAGEPGPLPATEAEQAASLKAANLKVSNLRLARATVSDAPPERTLLSALAGDVDGDDDVEAGEGKFWVFYPGLRLGADKCLDFKDAVRVDVAKMGNWGSQISTAATEDAMKRHMQSMKAEQGLPSDAWDPMSGPGWPGIYTDRRSRGLRAAAAEDVVECKSAVEAWALWSEIETKARANLGGGTLGSMHMKYDDGSRASVNPFAAHIPFFTPMRARLAPGTSDGDFADALRWLLNHSFFGRDQATNDIGLGLLGAYVIPGDDVATGVGLFSTQGSYAPGDFVANFAAHKARFAVTLNGRRFALEQGRAAFEPGDSEALEKPKRREWGSLNASPCGRFTCSTWWSDGSNYDDDDGRLLDFAPQ